LKLAYDKLLSNVAFNCNLRHYTKGEATTDAESDFNIAVKGDLIGGAVQVDPGLTAVDPARAFKR